MGRLGTRLASIRDRVIYMTEDEGRWYCSPLPAQ